MTVQDNLKYLISAIAYSESRENKRVKKLRSMPYLDYLKTDEWNETRKAALKRSNYECQRCGRKNTRLDVHHKTYKNRGAEKDNDLMVLCRKCHKRIHKGDKR